MDWYNVKEVQNGWCAVSDECWNITRIEQYS